MTDRVKLTLGRWSTALGIIVILVGFIAYMTRALDASTQAVQAIEKMNVRLDVETFERTKADKENAAAIASKPTPTHTQKWKWFGTVKSISLKRSNTC